MCSRRITYSRLPERTVTTLVSTLIRLRGIHVRRRALVKATQQTLVPAGSASTRWREELRCQVTGEAHALHFDCPLRILLTEMTCL